MPTIPLLNYFPLWTSMMKNLTEIHNEERIMSKMMKNDIGVTDQDSTIQHPSSAPDQE